MIDSFAHSNAFLSNFFNAPVEFEKLVYANNEAAFQAAKTLDYDLRLTFTNLAPNIAKRKGRKLELRSDWEDVKENIMYEIVLNKFQSHPDLLSKLIATGDHKLIEGNYWHDNTWGTCSCDKCLFIIGQNKLGKILMRVRSELANK